jgi:hypothetical protein
MQNSLAAGQRQHVAFGHQVGRREYDQGDLAEFARLDRETGQPDPDSRPVHLRDGRGQDRRQRQKDQPGQAEGVRVAGELAVIADDDQERDEQGQSDRRPGHLSGRGIAQVPVGPALLGALLQSGVQPMDHHQSEPVEQHDTGHQDRVGEAGGVTDGQVGDDG